MESTYGLSIVQVSSGVRVVVKLAILEKVVPSYDET
jgi:hypothetical protein